MRTKLITLLSTLIDGAVPVKAAYPQRFTPAVPSKFVKTHVKSTVNDVWPFVG